MKLFPGILLALTFKFSYGQTFKGSAPQFSSKTISVFAYEDFFTRTRLEKFNSTLDSKGEFSFPYSVSEPVYIDIYLEGSYSGIYVQPGFEYELEFDAKGKVIAIRSDDPTNELIKKFDEENNALYEFQKKRIYADKIKEFVNRQKREFEKLPEFARMVLTYRMGNRERRVLEDDTAALNQFETVMFLKVPIRNNFPDYFPLLTTHYFERANDFSTRRTPFDSRRPFVSMLNEYALIRNDSVQQFLYLSLLREAYRAPWGPPKEMINRMIDSIHNVSDNEKVRRAAVLLKRQNNSLLPGTVIKDFSFETVSGERHTLNEFKGKYVLLDFWFIGCAECVKSFPYLNDLKKRANGKLEIISLTPYDSKERLSTFLQKRAQFGWMFSPIDKNNGLLNYFSIGGYPTYVLMDAEGKFVNRFDYVHEKELNAILKLIE